jgi:hypothetical protein
MRYINELVKVEAYQDKRIDRKGRAVYSNHMKSYLCENHTEAIAHAVARLQKSYPEAVLKIVEAKESINHQRDKVMQTTGEHKAIYLYSNWLFSYDEVEAKEYCEARRKEREEETRRNKLLKQIAEYYKTLTTEELEAFVEIHK